MTHQRQSPFVLKSHQDDGFFCGYASVFQVLDHHQEMVAPQAFQHSLSKWQQKGNFPKMLWQHDQKCPIGYWTEITEDDHGLFVKGQLLLDLQSGREAYALLKAGIIDSLSIGFRPVKSKRYAKYQNHKQEWHENVRVLEQIDLHEISLVTFAANQEAKITTIKRCTEDLNKNGESSSTSREDEGSSLLPHHKQTKEFIMTTVSPETTISAPLSTEEKSSQNQEYTHMEKMLKKSNDRLNQLELAIKRPGVSLDSTANQEEKSAAFDHFIRKGIDDLSAKALISSSDAQGGYLIPTPSTHFINQQIELQSPIRKLARVASIHNNHFDILVDKVQADSGWVSETDAREETKISDLIKLSIPVHEIYAKPLVSQRLLDDSGINMESWLSQRIAEKMARAENHAFLFGDGDNKPKGILTYELSEDSGVWGKFQGIKTNLSGKEAADPLIDAFYSLSADYLPGACWVMSRKMASMIRKLKEKNGAYLWQNALSADTPNTLLGYPVHLCDELDQAQNAPILFGNLKETYQIVDRTHMTLLRDPYSSKPYVEFYATKRVGGAAINFDALKVIHIVQE